MLTIAHHFLTWDQNDKIADIWMDNIHLQVAVPVFGALVKVTPPVPDRRLWLTGVTIAAAGDASGIELQDAALYAAGVLSSICCIECSPSGDACELRFIAQISVATAACKQSALLPCKVASMRFATVLVCRSD